MNAVSLQENSTLDSESSDSESDAGANGGPTSAGGAGAVGSGSVSASGPSVVNPGTAASVPASGSVSKDGESETVGAVGKTTSRRARKNRFLGYDKAVLAGMFTPDSKLCNKRLELWIDSLTFISMPIRVRPDGTWSRHETRWRAKAARKASGRHRRRGRRRNEDGNDESEQDGDDDDDDDEGEDNSTDMKRHDFSTLATRIAPFNSTQEEESGYSGPQDISAFNVVFVIDPLVQGEYKKTIDQLYEHVVANVSAALKYEQALHRYVAQQNRHILHIREELDGNENVWDRTLSQCDLARVIKTLYESIVAKGAASLVINGNVDLVLQLPVSVVSTDIPSSRNEHPILTTAVTFSVSESMTDPTLASHYSILLLDEAENVLRTLPTERHPALVAFVRGAKSTKT